MTGINFITVCLLIFFPAFASEALSQPKLYPNEIDGYEFFAKGKLKNVQPGFSTKRDVKRIFGEQCEIYCDYDADWTVTFSYYEINTTIEETDKFGVKIVYNVDSKYIGKLRSIQLRPKKQISFSAISFPKTFKRSLKERQNAPLLKDRGRVIKFELYQDANGLTYELYDRLNSNKSGIQYNKGDLSSITYTIPNEKEGNTFFAQK